MEDFPHFQAEDNPTLTNKMTDIVLGKDHSVPPLLETKVMCRVDFSFEHGLINNSDGNNNFHIMDGVIKLRTNDIFSKHDMDVRHSQTLPHTVRLTDHNKVVSVNQYHLPFHSKEVAIDFVQKLLKSGVIRRSTSVFNSPLMLVKKPNADPKKTLGEQYRLVHNYIELNKLTAPCSYLLRHLYELLDEVASGKIFLVLDLSQGYFQQTLIDPKETTAFSIPGYGQFTYNRSPQGLNSSPAYFQRLLNFVLKHIDRCYVYTDDVVISAHPHQESLQTLKKVFSRFREHNLKINRVSVTLEQALFLT